MGTDLYRLYDSSGSLLYIGVANRWAARVQQHAQRQPWWPEVRQLRLKTYLTREDALEAERQAIVNEKPLHNIVHNRAVKKPDSPSGPMTVHERSVGARGESILNPDLGARMLAVLAYVQSSPQGVTPKDVGRHLKLADARQYLVRLERHGLIAKAHRGMYVPLEASPSPTSPVSESGKLIWMCERCGVSIKNKIGYIHRDSPGTEWAVHHRCCDLNLHAASYWIGVERIRTDEEMSSWIKHLNGKRWFDDCEWADMLRRQRKWR